MDRFYFHMRRGQHVECDLEGAEFPDLVAARDEACQAAREIVADAIKSSKNDLFDGFIIADESGRELETVALKEVLPKSLR